MEDFPRWCIRSTKTILLRFGLIKKTSRAAYFKKVMIQNLVKKYFRAKFTFYKHYCVAKIKLVTCFNIRFYNWITFTCFAQTVFKLKKHCVQKFLT